MNDDYTYNEARGENMAKDLLNGLPDLVYSKLMSEYRKCSSREFLGRANTALTFNIH